MNELKEHYNEDMPLADAEKLVLQILKAVMEERIDKENVEVMVIPTATRKCVKRTQHWCNRSPASTHARPKAAARPDGYLRSFSFLVTAWYRFSSFRWR